MAVFIKFERNDITLLQLHDCNKREREREKEMKWEKRKWRGYFWYFAQPAERSCHLSDCSTCGHRRPDSGSAEHPGKRRRLKPIAAVAATATGERWTTPGGSCLSLVLARGYRWVSLRFFLFFLFFSFLRSFALASRESYFFFLFFCKRTARQNMDSIVQNSHSY